MLDTINFNRIKIRDMVAAIKKDLRSDTEIGLRLRENLNNLEKRALENATEDDIRKIEQRFINHKLGIIYFPSERKKSVKMDNEIKIVSIDEIYG